MSERREPCPHCGHAPLHSITCIVEARTQPHAMVNDHGEIFYPDDIEDALAFAREEGARPLNSGDFPFVSPVQAALALILIGEWEPTRWWRAIGPDDELWAESSDEEEIRQLARSGDRIEHLWQTVPIREWRPE